MRDAGIDPDEEFDLTNYMQKYAKSVEPIDTREDCIR